ncbi:MAG: hypothetical protein WCK01_01340 [Candidatus Uhrbacteria bacterium]
MNYLRQVSRIAFAALAGILLFAQPLFVSAAILAPRSIIMQREQTGTASNQEIRMTTPSGVTVAGRTVVINYQEGFDLSSVLVSDIDLFYGPVTGLETGASLAAVPGVGIWGVVVGTNKITFTAPTNGGPVSPGWKMTIRIGTNANLGTNRIINPTGLGGATFNMAIDGTFGDTGGMDIPLYDNTSIDVTAIVGAVSPPPGGGGGSGGDSTAPTIYNIQAINITTSTATIIWQTDENANGLVDYGTTLSYTNNVNHANFVTSHSMDLSGLTNNTIYNFRITSADILLNSGLSSNYTFQTLPPPAAPIISNVLITNITDTSALVTWQTNIPADSTVEYGTTVGYGTTLSDAPLVMSHSQALSGLSIATQYHVRISSSASGLTATTGDIPFSTLGDTTAPANVFGFSAIAGDLQNSLSWTNPTDPDFSYVKIRARTDGYPTSETDGRFVYQGSANSFVDPGLVGGTTYYYTNYTFDVSGNRASGAFAEATPYSTVLPPPVLPPVVPPVIPPVVPPTGPGGSASTTTIPTATTPPPVVASTSTPPIVETPTSTIVLPPEVAPTSTLPIAEGVTIYPEYYGGNGTISLVANASGQLGSLVGRSVLVRVPTSGLGRAPQSAMIEVGASKYALTAVGGGEVWAASFVPSNRIELVPVHVLFRFVDSTEARASTVIDVHGTGRVLARSGINPTPQALPGATVTLYEMTVSGWQKWDGSKYGQVSPSLSASNGSFGFMVPNGSYRVVAEMEGYQTQERIIEARQNIVSADLILPQTVQIPVIGPILNAFQEPAVQETANIAAPIVVAVAIANVATAASAFSLLNYIWFLFTQPLLILGRRKRERWGSVYNALAKTPVDLAAVRLIHAKTSLILQTRVTDIRGRFSFHVQPGEYRIQATKQGFTFPSTYAKDISVDGEYLDVYHGEVIKVEEESSISVNIPMDPQVREEAPKNVILKYRLRQLQALLGFASPVVSLVAFAISPSWLLFGLFAGQVVIFGVFRRLAQAKPPKDWGVVYDAETRKPLGQTVVRIFDKKFNKLLETQVTDNHGNYGFFAKKNVYFVTADKPGFERYKSRDIDLSKQESGAIDEHIRLTHTHKGAAA